MAIRRLCLVITVLLALSARLYAEESCRTCHPDVKSEYEASIHAKGFSCTVCHGGDPAVLTLDSHAVAKGYIGKPKRTDIPGVCASCHADPNRMKPFRLSTDQYAQYQTSQHGLLLAKGDTRVAVCTDCHGVHRILARGEPNSPVSPRNIPGLCGRCHADQQLMAAYNIPADQLDKFRRSVHGTALFVDEHPSAPTCATCHGTHGAVALQGVAVGEVCGHCHSRTREYFNESPHKKAADEGKMSECTSCHGYHDTAPPDRILFDTACGRCHPVDSPPYLAGQKIKTMLTQTNESLQTAVGEMAEVEEVSPTVVRYRSRLQQARAYFMEALPVQHSLAADRVDDLTRNARSIGDEVRASVHGVQEEMRLRYVGLGVVWVCILFAGAVAYLYGRERQRARTQDGTGAGHD